jgi:dephospho-CoA kinase
MKVLGLTGGIACGKGTVSRMFRELGAPVIDADAIGHEIIAPHTPAWRELVQTFGESILRPDGTVDRAQLGKIVFADAAARAELNAITHPGIAQEIQTRLAELARGGHQIAIVEAALIGETNVTAAFDAIIVVHAHRRVQIARLMARDALSEEEAQRRIQAQMPAAEKKKLADFVIDNSGTIEETRNQVEALWRKIAERSSN